MDINTAEIVRRYQAGESGPEIARDLGCHSAVIYRSLIAAGVPRKYRLSTTLRQASKPASERNAEIIRRFLAGETQPAIAADLKMTDRMVRYVLSEAGVSWRDRRKAPASPTG